MAKQVEGKILFKGLPYELFYYLSPSKSWKSSGIL